MSRHFGSHGHYSSDGGASGDMMDDVIDETIAGDVVVDTMGMATNITNSSSGETDGRLRRHGSSPSSVAASQPSGASAPPLPGAAGVKRLSQASADSNDRYSTGNQTPRTPTNQGVPTTAAAGGGSVAAGTPSLSTSGLPLGGGAGGSTTPGGTIRSRHSDVHDDDSARGGSSSQPRNDGMLTRQSTGPSSETSSSYYSNDSQTLNALAAAAAARPPSGGPSVAVGRGTPPPRPRAASRDGPASRPPVSGPHGRAGPRPTVSPPPAPHHTLPALATAHATHAAAPPSVPHVTIGTKDLIGAGSFGNVYRVLDVDTNAILAMKEIALSAAEGRELDRQIHNLEREIRVMQMLDHPNIVKYLGARREGSFLHIFMEYVPGGTMTSLIRTFGPLKSRQAAQYTRQILDGLNYLHSKSIVHRDLKGDNLFVTTDGKVKVGDFGTSKELRTLHISNSVAGTPHYMAPEVVTNQGHGVEADVWSLGCCVIQMLTGKPPYSSFDNQYAIMFQVSKGDIEAQIPKAGNVPAEAVDFIRQCCRMRPADRPTTAQLLRHPWILSVAGAATSPSSPATLPAGAAPLVVADAVGGGASAPPRAHATSGTPVGRQHSGGHGGAAGSHASRPQAPVIGRRSASGGGPTAGVGIPPLGADGGVRTPIRHAPPSLDQHAVATGGVTSPNGGAISTATPTGGATQQGTTPMRRDGSGRTPIASKKAGGVQPAAGGSLPAARTVSSRGGA